MYCLRIFLYCFSTNIVHRVVYVAKSSILTVYLTGISPWNQECGKCAIKHSVNGTGHFWVRGGQAGGQVGPRRGWDQPGWPTSYFNSPPGKPGITLGCLDLCQWSPLRSLAGASHVPASVLCCASVCMKSLAFMGACLTSSPLQSALWCFCDAQRPVMPVEHPLCCHVNFVGSGTKC